MTSSPSYASSCNACRQCAPLGACLAFSGVEGAMPYLHGSQGCATYIRRYMISHFREPLDIASSSFSEESAVFGGERNFSRGLDAVIRQYRPQMVGIATTCLSETIGDDVRSFIRRARATNDGSSAAPELVHVSTPSYSGSHSEGYHRTVRAIVEQLAGDSPANDALAVFPSPVSPADLRILKSAVRAHGLRPVVVPDFSDRLDGPSWETYHQLPPGGAALADIRALGGASGVVDLGSSMSDGALAGAWLEATHGVARHHLALPIGLQRTDAWHSALRDLSGKETPDAVVAQRGRLVDAYVDGHKYVSGVTAAVFGEPDLAVSIAGFLEEIGLRVVLCATGTKTGHLKTLLDAGSESNASIEALDGADFRDIEARVAELRPQILLGNSKGYTMARRLDIPLVRVGFPIHDRFGGHRLRHLDYTGTQQLFDRIVNTIIEHRQNASAVGYTYM